MNLVIDYDSGSFEGCVTVGYTNVTGDPLSELFFRLFANDATLYGDAFVQVNEVSIQTASMPFSLLLDETVLMISLDDPLQPEEAIEVDLRFTGQASNWPHGDPDGSSHTGYGILTKSSSALTLTAFYPMLAVYSDEGWALDPSTGFGDTLMGDAASYSVEVVAKSGPLPVASGDLVMVSPQTGSTTYSFEARNARDFSVVLVEGLEPVTTQIGDAVIRTWFTTSHYQAGLLANEMAVVSFQLFEEMIGPSPFREIELVEVPLHHAAGVEFSGLVLIGSQYADRPEDPFFSIIVSHEMAHQWFYAGVGNDVSEHPWLDESFAVYLSYEFLGAYFGASTARRELNQWQAVYENAKRDWSHLSIGSPKYAFPNSTVYSSFVYSGGATFLRALRTTLGDDMFYRCIRTYYQRLLHSIATPVDLLRTIEDTCDCQVDDLFSEFRVML